MKDILKELKAKEEEPQDIRRYIEEISKDKKKILKKVENLDRIINDSEKLEEELVARKEAGESLKDKLQLKELLIAERQNCMNKIMAYNKNIDPRQLLKKTKKSTTTKVQLLD